MEFKDKIMLRCFPKMKCQQGMIFSTQLSRFLQAVSFIKYGISMYHIYNKQAYNKSFHESLESLQYQASLAITRAIKVPSKKIFYQ